MKKNDTRLAQTLNFHLAAQKANNRALLALVGFTQKDSDEGLELIRRATILSRASTYSTDKHSTLLERLDAFQARWFPAVRATLERHYPDVAKQFFAEMVQLSGNKAVFSVVEFLETLRRLGQGEPPFAEDGPAARALLAQRMLTEEVEADGNALLAEWGRPAGAPPVVITTPEEIEQAIDAAWTWRTEWADQVRVVVRRRGKLRALGLGRKPRAPRKDEASSPALPADVDAATPQLAANPPHIPGTGASPPAVRSGVPVEAPGE